ncbi:acylneuraminate cytidylyltransferase family protein [Alphaproteobacteria bacterium]|nr:acylneuraminate cytidylyltransferase family protein [Alphaproteobacteria bacterium]
MRTNSIAFIPARSGSKRISHKNIKLLNGHPLLAYSVRAAVDSNLFDSVVCVTDSPEYAAVAVYYGAEVPVLRPVELAGDLSPDIEWVVWILNYLKASGKIFDVFSILRPTSPFRLAGTIKRAYSAFIDERGVDSLRAVQKCLQHPGKMWTLNNNRMSPILPYKNDSVPWHSSQYSALPDVYVQDASLEIAWCKNALQFNTISGQAVMPFLSREMEGFDINEPEDWLLAEIYLSTGQASLPPINQRPFKI